MVFTNPTTANVVLWILIGVLVLVIIGFAVWRLARRNKTAGPKRKINPLKSTAMTNQIAIALKEVYGLRTLANVLVKNALSPDRFSLFPAVTACRGHFFIITNVIDGSRRQVHFGRLDKKLDVWVKRGKKAVPCIDWDFRPYNDMVRFVRSINEAVPVTVLTPYVGDVVFEQKGGDMVLVPLDELYDRIVEIAGGEPSPDFDDLEEKVMAGLGDKNVFAKKGTVSRRSSRGMLE